MADGSLALRRLMEYLDKNRDAFENDINSRTNVLDLPAHYPISPERFTLSVDGSRVFPQYDDVPQYTHDDDRHLLQPAAGETVILESAERPRYVVQFELAATWAFELSQSLTTGDQLRVGLYDGSDGYYLEQTGSHADDEADFVMERAGSVVYRKTNIPIRAPTTDFARLKLQTGWYNLTRQMWERSYAGPSQRENAPDSTQFNFDITTADMGDNRGPVTGNLPIHFEINADAGTTGLTLEAGSTAQVNLGTTTQFNRTKKFFEEDTLTVTDAWEPLRAFRIDPDRPIISVQLSKVTIGKYEATTDVELLLMAGDPSKVLDANGDPLTDADFSYPEEVSPQNNVIQTTTAVEQFPDNTGTPQTSMTNAGGWQLARSELLDGSGRSLAGTSPLAVDAKRPLYARDIAVVLGKASTADAMSYQIQTQQDW